MLESFLRSCKTEKIRLIHIKPQSPMADEVAKAEKIDHVGIWEFW